MTDNHQTNMSLPEDPDALPEKKVARAPGLRQLTLLSEFDTQAQKPVAVCSLTDDALRDALIAEERMQGILVGGLTTENLGIEQIIAYVLANPHIRFLVLCGADGQKAIGHLPGQSFLALAQNGLDENGRIIGAQGKRPVIQNISAEAVEHFRRTVEVLDLIGNSDAETIMARVEECIARSPGPAEPFETEATVEVLQGSAPEHMSPDPCGYFVISVDYPRNCLVMEHYTNKGVLNGIIEGATAQMLYFPAIDQAWVSRLDHAAYLGRELDRAERALRTGQDYVQDSH